MTNSEVFILKFFVIFSKQQKCVILDAVLKQGVLRIFQHGLVRIGTPLF